MHFVLSQMRIFQTAAVINTTKLIRLLKFKAKIWQLFSKTNSWFLKISFLLEKLILVQKSFSIYKFQCPNTWRRSANKKIRFKLMRKLNFLKICSLMPKIWSITKIVLRVDFNFQIWMKLLHSLKNEEQILCNDSLGFDTMTQPVWQRLWIICV